MPPTVTQEPEAEASASPLATVVLAMRLRPQDMRRYDELARQGNLGSRSNFICQLIGRLDALVGDRPFDVRKLTYDPTIVIEQPQAQLPFGEAPPATTQP